MGGGLFFIMFILFLVKEYCVFDGGVFLYGGLDELGCLMFVVEVLGSEEFFVEVEAV